MTSSYGHPRTRSRAGGLLLAALSFGVLVGADASATDPALDAALVALQKRYDGITDLHADFVQDARIASLGKNSQSRGSIVVKRPGRMRWEYVEPERQVIVLDGETVRMYAPGESQLQVASAGAGTFSTTALAFLLGDGDLRETFTAKRISDDERPELGITLQPKQDAGFDHLEIWVAASTHQLLESVVYDLFGNRTSVRFQKIRENAGVEDKAFEINVPEGTEVIDLR